MGRSIVVLCVLVVCALCRQLDPYKVLEVSRSATAAEIKKAYNGLAMKWHPDKNRSPEAADKMADINKAYEILSDENRKARYDLLGEISDNVAIEPDPEPSFTTTRSKGRKDKEQKSQASSQNPQDEINSRQFADQVVPGSHAHPYLLYYYHDFCNRCKNVTREWNKLNKELREDGIKTGSIHVITSTYATSYSKVFIHQAPHVTLMIKGVIYHYKQEHFTLNSLRDFVGDNLPQNILKVTKSSFLTSSDSRISSNKPLVIMFAATTLAPLHFNVLALKYNKLCQFVFASTSETVDNTAIISDYNITASTSLLIFQEEIDPVVRLEDDLLTKESLVNSVEQHKLLQLPRVTSSAVLDAVCPFSRTCGVMLVEGHHQYSDVITIALRQSSFSNMSYININTQHVFINKFTGQENQVTYCDDGSVSRTILVLHRELSQRGYYQWYRGYCGNHDNHDRIKSLLSAPHTSSEFRRTTLESIVDEDITAWSLTEFIVVYWEKIIAFMALPLPLLVMACYLYVGPHTLTRPQQSNNASVRRISTLQQPNLTSPAPRERRQAISLDHSADNLGQN